MPAAQVVLDVLDLARSGSFAEVRDRFAPDLQPLVVPEALAQAWAAALDEHGPIAGVGAPLSEPASPTGVVVVKVPVRCERGGFTLVAAASGEGRLLSLRLAPPEAAEPVAPWEPPGYADRDAFDEDEVSLESGDRAVGGTLSVPRAHGPRPAVVLLAGSGSLDRDETIGRNKPLKDIAWGLAGRGTVVLRFDKVTYTHAAELGDATDITLDSEYLPQAVAAIRLLHNHPAVDSGRIFLLGHSLGGTVAPRIAAAEPSIAGLIILAGGAQPLHRAIVRQARHLASLNPATEAAAQPGLAALTRKAEQVDSPDLSPATPAAELPLGAPAGYWLDLRGYEPAALAASLARPMLVLQGGRDYQVTVDDDLALWRAALAGRRDVTIRVYPTLNHLFSPGEGPSSPSEYEPAQHVDHAVVGDIAAWLGSS